jgi:hypothetical protein
MEVVRTEGCTRLGTTWVRSTGRKAGAEMAREAAATRSADLPYARRAESAARAEISDFDRDFSDFSAPTAAGTRAILRCSEGLDAACERGVRQRRRVRTDETG